MNKSIVFISHIADEKEVAIAFKELIEASFLGLIDVFVSSDEHSVSLGQKWLNNITDALKHCSVEIVLCSPQSIKRPWINFEAGAGWIREIPVIPLCHSGIEPSTLPLPLNLLQGAKANDVSSLNLLFPVLAQALGSATPKIDFSDFIKKVVEFEDRYTFWNQVNSAFRDTNEIHPDLIGALKKGAPVEIELFETQIMKAEQVMPPLEKRSILSFRRAGGMRISTGGVTYPCHFVPLEKWNEVTNNKNFVFKS